MKNIDKKKAFTLAETLIALVILGVVAAITIPALIQKYIEATNRTKLKKAMATYEKVINQLVVENNITGSIKLVFKKNDCDETSKYFKSIEIVIGNKCRFKTSDRVWWDISDIEHPIIAFSEEDLNDKNATNRFELFAHNEEGILRVNDLADKELTEDERVNLEKLYAFINNEKDKSSGDGEGEEPVDPKRLCSDDTKNSSGNYVSCKNIKIENNEYGEYEFYLDDGSMISASCLFPECNVDIIQLSENEKITIDSFSYNPADGEYSMSNITKHVITEKNGIEKDTMYNCEDINGTTCSDNPKRFHLKDKANNNTVGISVPDGGANFRCDAYSEDSYLCQSEGYTHCERGPAYSLNGQTFCCKEDEHVVNSSSGRYYCVKNE